MEMFILVNKNYIKVKGLGYLKISELYVFNVFIFFV